MSVFQDPLVIFAVFMLVATAIPAIIIAKRM